jgi:hypothetical protein
VIQTPHSRHSFGMPPRLGPAGSANPQASSSRFHPTTTTVCRRRICHGAPCRVLLATTMPVPAARGGRCPHVAGDVAAQSSTLAPPDAAQAELRILKQDTPSLQVQCRHAQDEERSLAGRRDDGAPRTRGGTQASNFVSYAIGGARTAAGSSLRARARTWTRRQLIYSLTIRIG